MRRGLRRLSLGLGVVGVVAACSNILGVHDLENANPPPIDAGPDIAPRDPCPNPPAPDRPDAADGTNQSPTFFSLDTIDFGSEFDRPGVNLDRRCTLALDGGSCVPLTGDVPTGQIDGPGGVDNSAVSMIASTIFPISIASEVKRALERRAWTLLFRLAEYDGDADDPKVSLNVVTGIDLADAGTWQVDGNLTDAGITAAPLSANGWVAGNVLRAEFKELPFVARSVNLGTFLMRLRSAYVVATLSPDRKKWTNGVIAGRWHADDITAELARLSNPLVNGCLGSAITNQHCRARDVMSDPTDDNKGLECDSVSVAFRFTAISAAFVPDSVDAGGLSPQICAGSTTSCK